MSETQGPPAGSSGALEENSRRKDAGRDLGRGLNVTDNFKVLGHSYVLKRGSRSICDRSLYMLWEDECKGRKSSWKETNQKVNVTVREPDDAGLS